MAISEAARADLYTGLAEVLGRDRAETLMSYLPTFEPIDVATRGDIAELRGEMDRLRVELRGEMGALREELRGEMGSRFMVVEERLDRLFLTLVGGLFVIVAAMVGLVVTAL